MKVITRIRISQRDLKVEDGFIAYQGGRGIIGREEDDDRRLDEADGGVFSRGWFIGEVFDEEGELLYSFLFDAEGDDWFDETL